MKPKKTPLRMCVGCREMKPKKELLRVVKSKAGDVAADPGGRMPGRGAYVCRMEACLQKAIKTRQLERALSCAMSPEITDALKAAISPAHGE